MSLDRLNYTIDENGAPFFKYTDAADKVIVFSFKEFVPSDTDPEELIVDYDIHHVDDGLNEEEFNQVLTEFVTQILETSLLSNASRAIEEAEVEKTKDDGNLIIMP